MIFNISSGRKYLDKSLTLINDLFPGNYSIDNLQTEYLFKYVSESQRIYDDKKKRSVFHNFLKDIIKEVAEKPFSKEVSYNKDYPEFLDTFKLSFDLNGDDLLKTAYNTMVYGLKDGVVLLLSDIDKQGNCFCRKIPAEDIIGVWTSAAEDGHKYINRAQFVIKNLVQPDTLKVNEDGTVNNNAEFKEKFSYQIFDMQYPNIIDIYNFVNSPNTSMQVTGKNSSFYSLNNKDTIEGQFVSRTILEDFDRLPLQLFSTGDKLNESNLLQVVPIFYDLAKLNLLHYNKRSDLDHIIRVSSFAILAGKGMSLDSVKSAIGSTPNKSYLDIGPSTVIFEPNPASQLYFVEHSGKAIESAQNDLTKLEKTMVSKLTKYLERRTVETATASTIDAKKNQLFALHLSNSLETIFTNILKDFAIYLKKPLDIDYKLFSFTSDYDVREAETKVKALIELRKLDDITRATFLTEMKKQQVLSNEVNIDDEINQLPNDSDGINTPPDSLNKNNDDNNDDDEET